MSKGFGDRSAANKPYARKPEGSFGDRPNRSSAPRSNAPRGDSPRGDVPRTSAPRNNSGEKFGNPRPRPTGDRANSNTGRSGGDSAPRRPRSFA